MGTLIDSSVLIAAERGALDFSRLPQEAGDQEVAVAAITAAELLHGVHRADTPARRARREAFVEALLRELSVLPFDLLAARVHARLWADLARSGTVVGTHDLQIAATALAAGMTVATRDLRSFPKIPGLALLRW